MYRVEVSWVPANELLTSFNAFISRREHKTMDLGQTWVRHVRKQVGSDLAARMTTQWSDETLHLSQLVALSDRMDRTPGEFLEWFSLRPRDELRTMMTQCQEMLARAPYSDVVDVRDSAVDLLSAWNETYFRHVDPRVLEGLRRERDAKQDLAEHLLPLEMVELATNGICFEPQKMPDVVRLIPQWHFRPWNIYSDYGPTYLFQYPADVLPTAADEPPLALLRLSRALGDESRLRILRSLAEQPRSFTDLVTLTGLSKSTVNHHMVALRAAGLVSVHVQKARGDAYTVRLGALDQLDSGLRAYLGIGDGR